MSFRDMFKRKMPATFNAVEYETKQILSRLDGLSGQIKNDEILHQMSKLSEKVSQLSGQLCQTTKQVEVLAQQNQWLRKQFSENQDREIRITPKPILRIEMHVAETCNLNCRMCSHFSCIAKPEILEPEILERDMKRLAELYDNGVQYIKFLGGEPLLNPRLSQLCYIVRKYFPNTHLLILTNGTLLPKMDESFWIACRETGVEIQCTEYPIPFDYSAVAMLAEQHGVSYLRVNSGEKTFRHMPLDLSGRQDSVRNFKCCDHANDMCISLYHGRMYTCTVAMNARHFEDYFHAGITLSSRDSIDIYEVNSAWEIAEFLSRPIPFCRFCDVSGRTWGHKWGKTEGSIQEWTLPCPKENI